MSAHKSPKKSSAELLDLADDLERNSSEEEQLVDSDMDQMVTLRKRSVGDLTVQKRRIL